MIIHYEQIKDALGGKTIDDVIVRMDQAGIKYLIGKRGKPFTTEFALNQAMGLRSSTQALESTPPVIEVR